MKLIVLLFINLVAYAASEDVNVRADIESVQKTQNQWLLVSTSGEKTIKSAKVLKDINEDADLTVEYKVTDTSGKVLGKGSGEFCSKEDSPEGSAVTLLGKYLGIQLGCPVSEQSAEAPSEMQSGKLILDKNPGNDAKIMIDISIKKGDTAIVSLSLYGRATS